MNFILKRLKSVMAIYACVNCLHLGGFAHGSENGENPPKQMSVWLAIELSDFKILADRYSSAVELSRKLLPEMSDPYKPAFVGNTKSTPQLYLGGLLRASVGFAWRLHDEMNKFQSDSPRATEKNQPIMDYALKGIRLGMAMSCTYCRTPKEVVEFQKATREFFEIMDIRAAKKSFSGLPFFDLMKAKLRDETFIRRTEMLYTRLLRIVHQYAIDPAYRLDTNLFAIAKEICGGNDAEGVELLGLLLSRDVQADAYLKRIPVSDPHFIRSFTRIALLTRLIVELDRASTGNVLDRFSYDGTFSSPNIKNYYYWSASLVALKLKEKGYSNRVIQHLVAELPKQYKRVRGIGVIFEKIRGQPMKDYKDVDIAYFKKDLGEIIDLSKAGAKLAIDPDRCPFERVAEAAAGLSAP